MINEPRIVLVCRMPESTKNALDAYANKHDISISEAVRLGIACLVSLEQTTSFQPPLHTLIHGNTKYANSNERQLARSRQRAAARKKAQGASR